jgi:hypothetical protein
MTDGRPDDPGSAMNETLFQTAEQGSPGDVPAPVLLNVWKHHAAALRWRIGEAAAAGPAGLQALADAVVVIGTELMDLYTGRLSPAEIAAKVIAALEADNRLSRDAYRAWLEAGGGYRVIAFAEDASRWVLRLGDEAGRYAHVHPARWAPCTRRVRANVLKTTVMVLAYARLHGGDPSDRALVNRVRKEYLGLAPLGKDLADDQGIGAVIEVLQ